MSRRHQDPLKAAVIEHVGRLLDPDGWTLTDLSPYAELGDDAPAEVEVQRLGGSGQYVLTITTWRGEVRDFNITVRRTQHERSRRGDQ